MTYSDVWDLDVFFEGGSSSPQLREHLEALGKKKAAFAEKEKGFQAPQSKTDSSKVAELIEDAKEIMLYLRQAGAFIGCLEAQDMKDRKANALRGELTTASADFQVSFNSFQQKLSETPESAWEEPAENRRSF